MTSRIDEVTRRRARASGRRGRITGRAALVALILLATLPGLAVAFIDGGPSVFSDERLYRDNALAIATLSGYENVHYPPVYPLLLALGYLAGDWYRAMLVLNVVASAAVVPATWFLARVLGLRRRWVPALLAALLPFHAAFAGYLLSENLAVTLLVLAVALAVRGRGRDGVALGLVLGALHLTRYFFLPAVVLLAVVWWWRLVRTTDGTHGRAVVRPLFRAAASYGVVLAIWVGYGLLSGYSPISLWGLSTARKGAGRVVGDDQFVSLLTWLTHYSGYLLLATPVAWALIGIWLTSVRLSRGMFHRWSPVTAYGAVTLAMTAGYLGLAAMHSRGAAYNHPDPSHMQGRYMMHVVPLVVVAGCLAMERTSALDRRPGPIRTVTVGTTVAAATYGAWWVLFEGGLWSVPAWGATLPFNAVDVFVLQDPRIMAVAAAAAVVVPLLALASTRAAVVTWAAVSALICGLGVASAYDPPVNGLRERRLAEFVADQTEGGNRVTVWLSDQVMQPSSASNAFGFWGVDPDLVSLEPWDGRLDETVGQACLQPGSGSGELWVTGTEPGPGYEMRVRSEGDEFGVYEVRPGCMDQVVSDYQAAVAAQQS